ncbi:uncharacterized protein Z518_05595 [Rhinocladiella mackenziei CBS 650.93]|uniref:Uncharacterized protein n=1 Tax=Rhinocladiella mackenziei CBS 650.93 TaxID=1442369 RepID=A0A0D2J6P1_9EURO|nr:uncharacterized protein Z518_05595 [Rhinocladiella mackenziei CBS 650.93]KIX04725.1 hypothetical protein Z518_05595 [Rhinocladiella mackenziei CBS 650.93]
MFPDSSPVLGNKLLLVTCLLILIRRASSQQQQQQLVGCDVLGCQTDGCTLGNTTNALLGTASFNTSISPDGPLTWTVGVSTEEPSNNATQALFTKNFYLGYPPSLDLASASDFSGCALIFEGIAKSLPLNSITQYGTVTCGETLQDACVNDLVSQAQQQVQTLRTADGTNSTTVCASLQPVIERSPPPSCQSIAQVTWGSIIAKGMYP